jgi:hypothetical protein
MKQLEARGDEKVRAYNIRNGAGDNQFGVKLGDIRVLAKKIKSDHELAMGLWKTGNIDAQLLATLVIKPQNLSAREMDRMVRSVSVVQVAEWLNSYVVKQHPDKESLRQGWMATDHNGCPRRMEPDGREGGEESGRAGPYSAAGSHRVGNGERGSGSAVDDEQYSCGNWNQVPQTPQAGDCHRRKVGNLSRLSLFKGMHVAVRADLD